MAVASGAPYAWAVDGTWTGPGSDWNTGTNWSSTPTVPTGTATFSGAAPTAINIGLVDTVDIDEMLFTAGAPAYTFDNDGTFNINGTGIVNKSSNVPTFINEIVSGVNFNNSSTAGNAAIINNSFVEFFDHSTAGNAAITNNFELVFHDTSTAGNAGITNNNALFFINTSRAGNADIINNGLFVGFENFSTADNADIINNSLIAFLDNSTAGNAAIINNSGGTVDFSASTGPANDHKLSAGSIAGAGNFYLGADELTVGGNNASTEVSGVISDCGPTGTECQNSGATGGSLVKTGTGTFTLSGANTYTGATTVEAGKLVVNGSIVSPTTVDGGATLGGTGTIGNSLAVLAGGVLAPGNSIGTMTVNGPFTLNSGAIYAVEANAAGQSDRTIVNGTVNLTGAVLRVLAIPGAYAPNTRYTIIDNDLADPVQGTFGSVTVNSMFLTPTVLYNVGAGANDVALQLTAVPYANFAKTPNQKAVAGALDRGISDGLAEALFLLTPEGARHAFDALSGEIYASVQGVLADESRYVREAILGRLIQASYTGNAGQPVASLGAGGPQVASLDAQAMTLGTDEPMAVGYDDKSLGPRPRSSGPGVAFWTSAFGAWGDFDGNGNAATANRNLGGFVSGMDARVSGSWRAGLAAGGSWSDISVDARHSDAQVQSFHLGGYTGGMAGPLALRGGGVWAWNDVDTSRAVVFPGFFERETASYQADTGQAFGELAYPLAAGAVALEPFAGIAGVMIDTENFKEHGGALAALRARNLDENVGYSTVGLRLGTVWRWQETIVVPHLSAAWQHAFDDVTPQAALAFASTGIGFAVTGVPLAQDSALIDAGADLALAPNMTLGASYSGQLAHNLTDNAVKGRFTWVF